MFLRNHKQIIILTALTALVGCQTVERAREAQKSMSDATNDVAQVSKQYACGRINLVGGDLYDYAAFAMTNRPSLEASRLAVSNATLNLISVSSSRALQAKLAAGYGQSTQNHTSHFSWHQPRGKATTDVTFDLLLCDFGRLDAKELEAREKLAAARRDLSDGEYAVFNEVSQAYFTLLRNDALLAVARTNEFMFAEHLRQSESLFEAGEAKKLDVLKARVDLSDARLATINASNDVVTASAEFMRSLGISSDCATRGDIIAVAGDVLSVSKRKLPTTSYDAVEGLEIARTNAPSIMVLRAKLRAASARVDYAVADLLPELTLSSTFSFADPAWNWSWGLRAVQTLLDGFRKQTAVDMAVVDMLTARTVLEAAEQQLSCDLSLAAAARDNAARSFETASVSYEQAKENYQNVMAQYQVGDASRLDFTDAANTLASALGAQVRSFYAGEIAEAKLIRLTGRAPDFKSENK